MTYRKDLEDSIFEFNRVVMPIIGPVFGGNNYEYIPVEGAGNDYLRSRLDELAGIDGYLVYKGIALRAMGLRNQWIKPGAEPWDSFTVRTWRESGAATELYKRMLAINNKKYGFQYPHLTIQSYTELPRRQGKLVSLAVTLTESLIQYADSNPDHIEERNTPDNGAARFLPIWWKTYEKHNPPLKIWKNGCWLR